ncbi:hypothetical protein [Streptomyces sp. NPDC005407]|uniref:hypothetical protein n=1 Tax=Streptomyces sp. NPDC005407 TaxID=3155340 RepID=UPI0033B1CD67
MSIRRTAAERAAYTRWQKKRRWLVSSGQWQPFVDAEPVRQHLRRINAAGMPFMAISERLGLAQNSSLQHLMWGRGAYGPGQQVRTETADLVLAYWPTLDDFPDAARIDATGTRRRVQALVALGWPRHWMAEQVGVREDYFRKVCGRDRVTARVARQVAVLYDAWWDQDPLEHGLLVQSVSRVRADAVRAGFHSPLAWDDDTIDDPDAVPLTDALEPAPTQGVNVADRFLMGESVVLDRAARLEVLGHLMEWTNDTVKDIAARLEMSEDAVEQAWSRIKRRAKKQGGKVPWRRAYIPRRELKRDEVESAA